jgi:hypothetical protein
MTYVNESDLVLVLSERLKYTVDPIAGQAKNRVDAPRQKAFYKHI